LRYGPIKLTNNKQNPTMTSLRSLLARASVLTMVVLRTCHGFYVPGVRPYEFSPGEEVPMKVNALTSIHTQVRTQLALYESLTILGLNLMGYFFIDNFTIIAVIALLCIKSLPDATNQKSTRSQEIITVSPSAVPPGGLRWPPKI
jgi:hypothetical protein